MWRFTLRTRSFVELPLGFHKVSGKWDLIICRWEFFLISQTLPRHFVNKGACFHKTRRDDPVIRNKPTISPPPLDRKLKIHSLLFLLYIFSTSLTFHFLFSFINVFDDVLEYSCSAFAFFQSTLLNHYDNVLPPTSIPCLVPLTGLWLKTYHHASFIDIHRLQGSFQN